jgi:hypothetical protein
VLESYFPQSGLPVDSLGAPAVGIEVTQNPVLSYFQDFVTISGVRAKDAGAFEEDRGQSDVFPHRICVNLTHTAHLRGQKLHAHRFGCYEKDSASVWLIMALLLPSNSKVF